MAEVDVRRGGVDPELDPQRPALRQLALQRALGQGVDRIASEESGLLARAFRHEANARLPPRRRAGPGRRRSERPAEPRTESDRRASDTLPDGRPGPAGLTMQEPPSKVLTPRAPPLGAARSGRTTPPNGQAQGQEAAAGADPGRAVRARPGLDGVRDDDGRRERPAPAGEQGRVQEGAELDGLRRREGQATELATLTGNQNRILVSTRRDLAEHQERRDRDRGPALLRARGRGLQGHRPRAAPGHAPPERRAGRVDDHPAVREERARGPGQPVGVPEAARGGAGLPPRAQVAQAEGAHPVPEQRLLRQRRLRRRGGRAHLLQARTPRTRQRPGTGRGTGDGSRPQGRLRPRPRCWPG